MGIGKLFSHQSSHFLKKKENKILERTEKRQKVHSTQEHIDGYEKINFIRWRTVKSMRKSMSSRSPNTFLPLSITKFSELFPRRFNETNYDREKQLPSFEMQSFDTI